MSIILLNLLIAIMGASHEIISNTQLLQGYIQQAEILAEIDKLYGSFLEKLLGLFGQQIFPQYLHVLAPETHQPHSNLWDSHSNHAYPDVHHGHPNDIGGEKINDKVEQIMDKLATMEYRFSHFVRVLIICFCHVTLRKCSGGLQDKLVNR